ncbi:alpha/beta fold hydrolase [Veronia pacifica]|uniref:AB hydrolase-1 domain-containing protein n=1 Tax=Veronia pacifica TaxID=1080227 RepID=A0A1C3EDJ7_9GAMM|nr:alpha/beta hydrolase [Veronia pacifica]ODA31303.1 hypothetical protein A8L45_17595 [Veronia pacifica]
MNKRLYFIPGTMCNKRLWEKLAPFLNPTIEPVFLDIPSNKTFAQIADEYEDMMDDGRSCLIGFSLGGYIACSFAARYPERVSKLFVISNNPAGLPHEEQVQRKQILHWVKGNGYHGISQRKAASLLDQRNVSDSNIEIILSMDKELGSETFVSQYQLTSEREDLTEAIQSFNFPTHFYISENDPLLMATGFNQFSKNPMVSVIRTSGSGHMLPLEKPRELAEQINSWFSQ